MFVLDGLAKYVMLMQRPPVKLVFSPIVIPLITRLEERFTQYEMQQISDLSTGYAIRLYELLICWRTTGKTPIIELTDFRQKLGF